MLDTEVEVPRARETHRIERFFVCIGAAKSGTTWLGQILARHPDVFMTPVKEIHYFDHLQGITQKLADGRRRSRYNKYLRRVLTQWHRWPELARQWGWYRAYMAGPVGDDWYGALFRDRNGRTVAGEATPEYALIGEEGFRHLKRLAPDARLLFVMRDPVARAWSHILHHCRRKKVNPGELRDEEIVAIVDSPIFEALGDYMATLDHVGAVFPADSLLVEFYEDIHADRAAALERICGFIGVGSSRDWFPRLDRRINRSQAASMTAGVRAHLTRKYAGLAREVERRMGRVPDAWKPLTQA